MKALIVIALIFASASVLAQETNPVSTQEQETRLDVDE
jgi:hypothetical protein